MIILTATTDKISMITSAAVTTDVHSSYVDISNANPPVVQGDSIGRKNTAFSTATTLDISGSPASGDVRNVKMINIRNKHATSSVDVTVQFDQNSTLYELVKVTLRAGETLEYVEGVGWYVIATVGAKTFVLASDVTTSSSSMAEVTGLSQLTGVGAFVFRYYCIVTSAATTTGHKWSVNHDGTVSNFNYWIRWMSNANLAADDVATGAFTTAAAAVVSGFAARAKTTAGTGAVTDVDATNSDVMFEIIGHCNCTVDGNLELWWAPEAAASATLKAGSLLAIDRP